MSSKHEPETRSVETPEPKPQPGKSPVPLMLALVGIPAIMIALSMIFRSSCQ